MTLNFSRSHQLFEKAQRYLVGGVNSPVRAFKSVGGEPLFVSRGEGPFIFDADGNRYIDYVGSYGPLILGHCDPVVTEALKSALNNGSSFGASTEREIELAELIHEAFPAIEKIRFVNSGTEAVMSAIRLARAATGKNKIIKFAGCYHGHSDFLLAQAGSGVLTLSLPGSAGVPDTLVKDTLIAAFNDIESLEKLFEANKNEIAAVIVEPVPGNMGVVLPQNGFLKKLQELVRGQNALLICDEVMSGFRQNFGGAQKYFEIDPDITCLGKVIGGGLPVGAYGGKAEIMDRVAPLGPVYQAGTLSGNPLAMTAGIYTLRALRDGHINQQLNQKTEKLAAGIREIAARKNIPLQVNLFGSMFTPFFNQEEVTDYSSATRSNTAAFAKFFWGLIRNGVYPPPSQFEAWFMSAAHGEEEINSTLKAMEHSLT